MVFKQSKTSKSFKNLSRGLKIPFLTSRFALDLYPYSLKENMGLLGIKGSLFGEKLIKNCDLVIARRLQNSAYLSVG